MNFLSFVLFAKLKLVKFTYNPSQNGFDLLLVKQNMMYSKRNFNV